MAFDNDEILDDNDDDDLKNDPISQIDIQVKMEGTFSWETYSHLTLGPPSVFPARMCCSECHQLSTNRGSTVC